MINKIRPQIRIYYGGSVLLISLKLRLTKFGLQISSPLQLRYLRYYEIALQSNLTVRRKRLQQTNEKDKSEFAMGALYCLFF